MAFKKIQVFFFNHHSVNIKFTCNFNLTTLNTNFSLVFFSTKYVVLIIHLYFLQHFCHEKCNIYR